MATTGARPGKRRSARGGDGAPHDEAVERWPEGFDKKYARLKQMLGIEMNEQVVIPRARLNATLAERSAAAESFPDEFRVFAASESPEERKIRDNQAEKFSAEVRAPGRGIEPHTP